MNSVKRTLYIRVLFVKNAGGAEIYGRHSNDPQKLQWLNKSTTNLELVLGIRNEG